MAHKGKERKHRPQPKRPKGAGEQPTLVRPTREQPVQLQTPTQVPQGEATSAPLTQQAPNRNREPQSVTQHPAETSVEAGNAPRYFQAEQAAGIADHVVGILKTLPPLGTEAAQAGLQVFPKVLNTPGNRRQQPEEGLELADYIKRAEAFELYLSRGKGMQEKLLTPDQVRHLKAILAEFSSDTVRMTEGHIVHDDGLGTQHVLVVGPVNEVAEAQIADSINQPDTAFVSITIFPKQ